MTFICSQSGRLDTLMSKELGIPRNQIEQLIKNVGVLVDHKMIKKSSFKLKAGELVEYQIIQAKREEKQYEVDFNVTVLYEDEDILVLNKPPFLTVHGAPSVKEATLVDWLIQRGVRLSTISGEERHGIVHRIDKETSGALVVAKNNAAHAKLSAQLEDKSMGRYYLALIDIPLKQDTIIDQPIARNLKNRLKMDVIKGGRASKSAFCKLALSKNSKIELIAAKLFSGRTHQIRVHLQALSRHILGDGLYGFKSQNSTIPRVMLHAYLLYLRHPSTGKYLLIRAPLFDDFQDQITKHFDKDEIHAKISENFIIERFSNFD